MNKSAGRSGWNPRSFHRILGVCLLLFTLYLAVTGSVMQSIDLHAILSRAPGTNKEMVQIREGTNGPASFIVIQPQDYEAAALPENFEYATALNLVLQGARRAVGVDAPFSYVDLRVADGKAIGVVRAGKEDIRIDAATGTRLPYVKTPVFGQDSNHLRWKVLHVLRGSSRWITLLHAVVGIGLFTLTIVGLVLYFRLLRTRSAAGRNGLFWSSGGFWRSLHRGVSVVAAVFLLFISATGTMLAIDGIGGSIFRIRHSAGGTYAQYPDGATADLSSPLTDAQLPTMLQTTLAAERQTYGSLPVKAVRLRLYAGIPQGIVIAGSGSDTKQLVFHAKTGRSMSMTEPEYPRTHYYLGWQEHEWMKQIHRGDAFGVTGRLIDLLSGLSLIYLSISGGVMYITLWRMRRRAGRGALFWA